MSPSEKLNPSSNKLEDLRPEFTDEQRTLIDAIWNYYKEYGNWIKAYFIQHKLEPMTVRVVADQIGGSFLIRSGNAGNDTMYMLTTLGLFVTEDGAQLLRLLVMYLEFVKTFVIDNPEQQQIESDIVIRTLQLTQDESKLLRILIFNVPGVANGGTSSINASGVSTWSAGRPTILEDLFSEKNIQSYMESKILRGLDRSTPIDWAARMQYLENPRLEASDQVNNILLNEPRVGAQNEKLESTRPNRVRIKSTDPYRLVGTQLNERYALDEYVGSGGMGAVYRAYGNDSDNPVAVKILKPDLVAKNHDYVNIFQREINAARSIDHPKVVKILDNGTDGDLSYIIMEWLNGRTLEEVLKTGPVSLDRVTSIIEQVCSAFDVAHSKRIIHLDIKPANIFLLDDSLEEDDIKVIDFGLARILSADSGTNVTRFFGTYQYCSPEHFGGKVSPRSDIYSIGITVYHLLAGVLPLGTSYINAKQHPNLELPPLPSLINMCPDLPVGIESVILKATRRNPDDRQQTVRQFMAEFRAALSVDQENPIANNISAGGSVENNAKSHTDEEQAEAVKQKNNSSGQTQALSLERKIALLKTYLAEERHRIRLHDLVLDEVEALHSSTSENFFPLEPANLASDVYRKDLLDRIDRYERLAEPLIHIFATGCHYGNKDHQDLWVKCLERIADPSKKIGTSADIYQLRFYPSLLLIYAGGIGALAARKYDTVLALLTKPRVEDLQKGDEPPIVLVVNSKTVMERSLARQLKGGNQNITPLSGHLFSLMQEPLKRYVANSNSYARCIDRFEYLLALVHADLNEQIRGIPFTGPMGGFVWRDFYYSSRGTLTEINSEIKDKGERWEPLQAGLMGGSLDRLNLIRQALDQEIAEYRAQIRR